MGRLLVAGWSAISGDLFSYYCIFLNQKCFYHDITISIFLIITTDSSRITTNDYVDQSGCSLNLQHWRLSKLQLCSKIRFTKFCVLLLFIKELFSSSRQSTHNFSNLICSFSLASGLTFSFLSHANIISFFNSFMSPVK